MIQDFEVKTLFDDQFHERHQFEFSFEGKSYQGVFHNGEISWFHPLPSNELENDQLKAVESKVTSLMSDHLQ